MRRAAEAAAEGAKKHGDFNWENGIDTPEMLQRIIRHVYLYLSGDREEDHLGHIIWRAMGAAHAEELWPHLNEGKLRGPGCTPPGATQTDLQKVLAYFGVQTLGEAALVIGGAATGPISASVSNISALSSTVAIDETGCHVTKISDR